MHDIVRRVPTLSFIDMADVLVFARAGRSNAEGAFATCHCLTLPPSEPGYYFWRDRSTHRITRRSEWFVTKSPTVYVGTRQVKYMISFDPAFAGIRRIEKEDGTYSANCHGQQFFEQVAGMVHVYLKSRPSPDVYDFLCQDFSGLDSRHGGVVATSFRSFPSFPQRYIERLSEQLPCEADKESVAVEPLRPPQHPTRYTDEHLHVRHFLKETSRRLIRKGEFRAA